MHYWSIDATVNILFVCVAIWRINRTLQQVSESYVVNGHSRYAHCTMCHLGLMHIVRPYTPCIILDDWQMAEVVVTLSLQGERATLQYNF